jgi:hypothetical protein
MLVRPFVTDPKWIDLINRYRISALTNYHESVPVVVMTFNSFSHSWLIIGFVTRVTQRMHLVKEELLALHEHLRSPIVLAEFVLPNRYTDSDYPFDIFTLFLTPTTFYVVLNVCRKSGKWALMYMFVNGIDFASAIGFFNCSDFFGF